MKSGRAHTAVGFAHRWRRPGTPAQGSRRRRAAHSSWRARCYSLRCPDDSMKSRLRPRVLVADDHSAVLKSLQRLLSFDCDVVGTVDDGRALLESVARLQPDVVVADLNMPHVN